MKRNDTFLLAKRALQHLVDGTTDQAAAPRKIAVEAYVDPVRYAGEIEQIFKRRPLALALSVELAEAGSYLARTEMGVPVLMSRGKDGKVRAFLNVCRHRGAALCKEGAGTAPRFVCPYHAWSYDREGKLVGMYGRDTFGDVDETDLALTSLACEERAGLIWVCLTPGVAIDLDQWLGEFAGQLETLELGTWHLFEQRVLPGPGWKVALDGYLEVYHHDSVHGQTVGQYTIGNLLVHDTFGPHQRLVFGRKNLKDLIGTPECDWDADDCIRVVHSVFPNLSISGVVGDHCLVSQIFPGPTPETTLTRQTVLSARKPETPEELQKTETFSAMTLQAVRDEDYAIGFSIQAGLKTAANKSFVFGRNEPALQHYHMYVERLSAPGSNQ
jgi:phenylpropionate dioxygenase-like ring-hydroxylating dioxygenase large terminal subunit